MKTRTLIIASLALLMPLVGQARIISVSPANKPMTSRLGNKANKTNAFKRTDAVTADRVNKDVKDLCGAPCATKLAGVESSKFKKRVERIANTVFPEGKRKEAGKAVSESVDLMKRGKKAIANAGLLALNWSGSAKERARQVAQKTLETGNPLMAIAGAFGLTKQEAKKKQEEIEKECRG